MMMKKVIARLLCLTLLLCFLPCSAFADDPGQGNIDGGGGGMGQGTVSNFWDPGDDGVRITVVDADTRDPVSTPVDFSSRNQPSSIIYFGRISKIHYRAGTALSPHSEAYLSLTPEIALPTIVRSSGSNIEAIKKYFCSEYACMMVATAVGIDYETLIGGKYKLLLEPLVYFTFNGQKYCMSATEAALYDQLASGGLRAKMGSLTCQTLPLAMFLEYGDLGFAAWDGPATGRQSNSDIINYLGLGIVRFRELVIEGTIEAPDVEYRVDTDVITSVTLRTNANLTPDNPASVTFRFINNGKTFTVNNIVIPANNSQIVWIKWRTPSTPQDLTIHVSGSGAYTAQDTFVARIVDLSEKIPPDPLATDKNPGYTVPALPSHSQKTIAHWGVWRCYWVPRWLWHGYWCDHGYWEYAYDAYTANLSGSMALMPDDIVPTAANKNMKSGYAVKINVSTVLSTNASTSHYTYTQTALATFPEFRYGTYLRLLQRVSGGLNAKFQFKPNEYSTSDRAVHFTPLWYPNGKRYTAYTRVWDTWTPDGMLSINVNDYVNIQGSLYDDWYTNRE